MKTKIIEHTLKQITIAYGYNNNSWTDEDEALVQALQRMYDRELAMNAASDALIADYYAADRERQALHEELGKVAVALDKLRSDADELRQHFGLPVSQPFANLGKQAEQVSNLVASFREGLLPHEEKMAKLCDRLNEALRDPEDLTLWDQYSDIKYRHFDNHETNSIDIEQYRTVDVERRTLHEHYADQRRRKAERCREIHDENRCFALGGYLQIMLWDEFVKRLILLGYIFGQKEMLPGVWEN